jgi:hypothetical protein
MITGKMWVCCQQIAVEQGAVTSHGEIFLCFKEKINIAILVMDYWGTLINQILASWSNRKKERY